MRIHKSTIRFYPAIGGDNIIRTKRSSAVANSMITGTWKSCTELYICFLPMNTWMDISKQIISLNQFLLATESGTIKLYPKTGNILQKAECVAITHFKTSSVPFSVT